MIGWGGFGVSRRGRLELRAEGGAWEQKITKLVGRFQQLRSVRFRLFICF